MDDANSVSPPGGGPARGSVRVVLADGSAEMRELLRAQLETLDGVRIVGVASDGTEAVAQAVRQVPDLMLLDIAMPTVDGLEATAEIRRRLPAAKIVVFSPSNAEQMADPARAAGADAYLEKAAPGDELVALIRRLFPDAQLAEIPPAALPVGAAADAEAETKDARRFRLLVDAIDEGVLVVDANRRVVCANSAAARILAVPTSRLLGRALPEFGLDLSADGPVTMAFGGRPMSTVPVQVRDAQGTSRWLVVSTRPLLEPGKTVPTEVLVSFDDHTERRRTESHYQALAASLPDVAVVVVGDDLRFTVATGADLAAAGWRAEDLLGRTPAEVLGADRARTITEAFRAALDGEHRELQRTTGAAGRERIWHTEYTPVRDPAGTVIAAMAVSRDVTDQVRATGRFQLLFDEAPIGIALTGPDGRWLQVNPALCALVGYSAEDLLARDFQSITHPDDLADSVEQMRRMLAGEISFFEMDKRYLHRDGHTVWAHLTVSITRHHDGSDRSFIAQIQDITERRQVEHALQASEERYRRIVELAHEGIWTIDADARTTYVNARMAEIFGYSVEDMLGRHVSEFMDEDGWRAAAPRITLRRQGKSERVDVKFRRRDGNEMWAHLAASAILADDGSYQGALALVTDITARKSAEAELGRLACHDALTGLANRARLVQRIGAALAGRVRAAGTVGLLCLDLDQFQNVNDSLGHAAGDQVLAQVADRLRGAVRDGDIVARLGGDEFVVIAEHLSGEGAAVDLAERILGALADPITVGGLDIVVTASIGIALADPPTTRSSDDRGGRSAIERRRLRRCCTAPTWPCTRRRPAAAIAGTSTIARPPATAGTGSGCSAICGTRWRTADCGCTTSPASTCAPAP